MNPNQKKHNQNEMKINQGGQGAIDLYLRVPPPQDPRRLARNAKQTHKKKTTADGLTHSFITHVNQYKITQQRQT